MANNTTVAGKRASNMERPPSLTLRERARGASGRMVKELNGADAS